MDSKTNLYLLVFPEKNIIKIGKADDVQKRINHLKKLWGDVDYAASYSIAIETEYVYKLEKSLHFLLSNHSAEFDDGEGRTEFFSIDAMKQALNHIRLYLSSNDNLEALTKGLPKPILQKEVSQKRKINTTEMLQKKVANLSFSIDKSNDKLKKILHLIIILLRFQSRIPFQYDIMGNNVVLRIKDARLRKSNITDSVMSLLHFYIDGFHGCFVTNFCTIFGEGDVLQFNIRLIKADDDFSHPYLAYVSSQIEKAICRLPKKSLAVTDEIPLIDEDKFFKNV